MKLSEHWLREWVNPPINTQQLASQLTMAGLEIESILPVAGDFKLIVVGKVIEVKPHPNADRLRVCQVDVGQKEALNIVCGGANVRAGLKVAVAVIGATLPNGLEIKSTKLRDVLSQGMICSSSELGLTETSEGIMELPVDAPIGKDLQQWLQLDDCTIDVHVTPNRGDCLSVAGVAREVAVLNQIHLKPHKVSPVKATIKDKFPININAPADCPRYAGRIIRGINPAAQTPMWMQERLRRSGVRGVHPVVDVTNYVLLELGQPMHAFDLEKLNQGIVVRHATKGEQIVLLNGQIITLDVGTLVIADKQQAQALAGIMGGQASAVSDTTKDIFLESAFFNPIAIAGRARQYGLNTDASQRFERGVDPDLFERALERATALLLSIVGGKAGPLVEVISAKHLPKSPKILLRKHRIEKLLGIVIADSKVKAILQRLGMQLKKHKEGWQVTVPSYRFDLVIEEDLIEEVVRVYGYDEVPYKQPSATLKFISSSEQELSLKRLRHLFVDSGYNEAITYSFISPKLQNLISSNQTALTLINPISADLSVMRSSFWPGLLSAVAYNQNRQQLRVRLFETGLCFIQDQNEIKQEAMLAGVVSGNNQPEQWAMMPKPVNFFDIKADVESLLALTGQADQFIFKPGEHVALHPGQTSQIVYQDKVIGYVGALHPALLHELDLVGPVYLFELQLSALTTVVLPKFQPLSKFPAVRRDISFWIDADIPVQEIFAEVRVVAGEWLSDLCLFDVYIEQKSAAQQRSLALGLLWQHPTRTLVDDEVDELKESVVSKLKQVFHINLRD